MSLWLYRQTERAKGKNKSEEEMMRGVKTQRDYKRKVTSLTVNCRNAMRRLSKNEGMRRKKRKKVRRQCTK